jgi:hypothetical protein
VGGNWFVLVICMNSFEAESTSLVEFDVWFDLPWFEGEIVICLDFRESWCFILSFAIEIPCVLIAARLSFKLSICHLYYLV